MAWKQNSWLPVVLALSIGVLSGALARWLGLPLPWMLGPMLGTTLAALWHVPVRVPSQVRPVVIPVIGVFLGSGFSPHLFADLGEWAVTLLALPLYIVVSAIVGYTVLRKFGGYDRVTAFFAAVPGGLTDMMLIGEAQGGDGRRIAMAHAVRIFVVITCVALFFGLVMGVSPRGGAARPYTGFTDLNWTDDALLVLCAVLGAILGRKLRLPAPDLVGPMLMSAGLHLSEIVVVQPPTVVVIAAQIIIGAMIGCRFQGTALREVGRDLALAACCAIATLAVAVVFAVAIATSAHAPVTQTFLAFSPGGLTEMSLLAFAMGQQVAYVSVAHIVRIVLVVFGTPLAFRALGWQKRD